MTETGKTLMGTFGITDFLVPMVLEDLTDEDARRRSRDGEGPSITWMVGHLLHYRYSVLTVLGEDRSDPRGETFASDATDGADYPTVAELQSEWSAVAADCQSALLSKSESEWEAEETGAHDEKSLRDQVVFMAWHEGYHLGVIGALRKEMGYPGPAEKVMAARQAESEGS